MDRDEGPSAKVGSRRTVPSIGQIRLTIGLFQGIAAWLLLRLVAPTSHAISAGQPEPYWSSRHPMLFAAVSLITAYIPVIAIAEIGRMRRRTLAIYLGSAGAVVAGLSIYDVWRDPIEHWGIASGVRVWPSFTVSFCTIIGLFIVNQLLEHQERGNTLFSRYSDYFEDSWMRGFQLVVSIIFALLVWGLLELGGALFHIIHLEWFQATVRHDWFRCPALAVAFAAAIHLTDVRPALLKGVRNVCLTLFSWLLPIVVTIGAGFLIALIFTGVKPLWATGHAASIVLWASAITVALLNAAYKDGDPSNAPPAALRWTGRLAGPVVLLLAFLASYAIGLRVYEYGWTPERVFSAAVAFMALTYGAGYTYASSRRETWLTAIESVNVSASLAILAILALLLSPAADPARVSVNSQLSRLAQNEISAADFDYQFLRFDSAKFGREALTKLADNSNAEIRARAARMQQTNTRIFRAAAGRPDPTATEAAFAHATVYPNGTQLPEDFRNTDFSKTEPYVTSCLRDGTPCDIYILPYGTSGALAIIVRADNTVRGAPSVYPITPAKVFQRDQQGKWVNSGSFHIKGCPGMVDALRAGKATSVPPEYDDLLVDGIRLRFSTALPNDDRCSKEMAKKPDSGANARDAEAPVQMGPAFAKP